MVVSTPNSAMTKQEPRSQLSIKGNSGVQQLHPDGTIQSATTTKLMIDRLSFWINGTSCFWTYAFFKMHRVNVCLFSFPWSK